MQRQGEQQFGITNVPSDRINTHERNGWSLVEIIGPASGHSIWETEVALKQWLREEVGVIDQTQENWQTTKMEVHSLAELKKKSGIKTTIF